MLQKKSVVGLKGLLAGVLIVSLVACSKVSAKNYQKLNAGMSRAEVLAILGEPDSSKSVDLLGVRGESVQWQSGEVKIEANFVNDTLLSRQLIQQ
ncbi:hypothetical protein HQ393_16715 [Chitinibacter bivalviorum]|uniref:DUF3862 domain-containing protein n=1 Tax=Chitinibacter bivalviorum TaxID=2739434 RepID=A0A7H9BMA3_9NEIS|nr:hypothetical protein [Chitinibacter bivalviorum]QLG89753.1 hypothetical protein HQ393_16715 [Chitinibacter bivalviorum]